MTPPLFRGGRPPPDARGLLTASADAVTLPCGPAAAWQVTAAKLSAVTVALLLAVPAVVFALLTWQVVDDGPLLGADADVSWALVHPDRFSELLSDLGNAQVALPALAVSLALAAWRQRAAGARRWWLPPLTAALVMALVPAVVVPLKEWTDRPGTPVVPPATGYFPSGHTTTAVVAYGSAVLVLLPWLRSPAARRLLTAGAVVLMLAVSYGLVRRGYHWPLDVVGGWCVGTVLLTLLWLALGRTGRRAPAEAREPSARTE